jgi:hypothetical protein
MLSQAAKISLHVEGAALSVATVSAHVEILSGVPRLIVESSLVGLEDTPMGVNATLMSTLYLPSLCTFRWARSI